MARLNTRTSATPASRAGTVDSLYRDPTPAPRPNGSTSTARLSSYSVMSPAVSTQNSDKENEFPASREATPRPKSRGTATASRRAQRLMTPDSGNANKRRRTGDYSLDTLDNQAHETAGMPVYQDEEQSTEPSEEPFEAQGQRPPTPDDDDTRYYDPDQAPEQRRMVAALLRDHHREVLGKWHKPTGKAVAELGRRPGRDPFEARKRPHHACEPCQP